MPELPEVETVRRGLAPAFEGARFVSVETRRPNLRFPFPEKFRQRLEGRKVLALRRRAKYLLADLDSGETLAMHLGMSGSFRIESPSPRLRGEGRGEGPGPEQTSSVRRDSPSESAVRVGRPLTLTLSPQAGRGDSGVLAADAFHLPRSKASKHDHVVFQFDNGARVVYNDPRRFGFMVLFATHEQDQHKLFADIGLEPLGDDFTAAALADILDGVRAPLKAALLDQKRIAGLGNIYVCEALHRAKLSPLREAARAPKAKIKALHKAIRDVLGEAIEAGGSTLRDHRQADGELGYFQHSFAVYDREGAACPHKGCQGTITRVAQNGRSTFYCAECQI